MRLRNKKTGEIIDLKEYKFYETEDGFCFQKPYENHFYNTIAEFAREWEIEKPKEYKEPLIKDEKIRKAVRAWAEANGYSLVKVGFDMASEPNNGYVQIHFEGSDIVDEDKYGVHTIAELCGEEEE